MAIKSIDDAVRVAQKLHENEKCFQKCSWNISKYFILDGTIILLQYENDSGDGLMIRFHDDGEETAKVRGKVVPVPTTKEYIRVGIASPIPNLDSRWK
jgi:hypothetical protein